MAQLIKNPIVHGIVTVILFILPTIISAGGSWQDLTIGGILVIIMRTLENLNSGLTVGGKAR